MVMDMELRIVRFRHVHDVSILSEKVFSFIKMRQLLYFAFGILIMWRAMVFRDPGAFAFSLFVFLLGVASAILSRGSCSFEARIALSILSVIDSLLTPKPREAAEKPREKQRKRTAQSSVTSTNTSRVTTSKVSIGVASAGLALFALSTLTLFGFETPLAVLGVYGLTMLAGVSTLLAFTGFFMFLCGALGNPLRRKVLTSSPP